MSDLIWIEISKQNIKHNTAVVRKIIGDQILLSPCIKSNAYGHDLIPMAKLLINSGANWLTVNSLWEAEKLRLAGIKHPIQVIGHIMSSDLPKIITNDLKIFISDEATARKLSEVATTLKQTATVHIKVDTGMNRQGVLMNQVDELIALIKTLPGLKLEGVATHFANADGLDQNYFHSQLKQFTDLHKKYQADELIFQCANSAATIFHPSSHFNMVRPGKAIYGYYPSNHIKEYLNEKGLELRPALSLKTRVSLIKNIPTDSLVGYGSTFKTNKPTKIATLPIGYYDGVDRKLSNRGWVLIKGQKAPIIGRVCMNITIVDVTDIDNIKAEDEVVVIGKQGSAEIMVRNITELVDTIDYEVVSRLREGIPRYYI